VLLLGFGQELDIRSVLTTEVINWARESVKELDLARRLVHYSHTNRTPPKHLEPELVMLRDPRLRRADDQTLMDLAARIKDRNYRLFAEAGRLVAINGAGLLEGTDPFELFERMQKLSDIDASHAFYLGYEMAKAVTALTLGKNYTQDQALRWGYLTRPEITHS
jgi:dihydropteroate synthase